MTIHDFSLDIETLSTAKNAVVLSIGAVYVNTIVRDNHAIVFPHEFYRIITVQDQIKNGRAVDYDTLKWWMKQPAHVRDDTFEGMGDRQAVTLGTALIDLTVWSERLAQGGKRNFWAKGVGFDGAILESAYTGPGKMTDVEVIPFRDWQEVRTMERMSCVKMQDQNERNHPALHKVCEDWKHHALYDARAQGAFVADEMLKGYVDPEEVKAIFAKHRAENA